MKRKYMADILLIIFLIISTIMISIFIYREPASHDLQVEVCVEGEVIKTYPLSKDSDYYMEDKLSIGNTLVIDGGFVYIKDANCNDELCVKQGRIKRANESIICLPHKLVVKITSGDDSGSDDELDVIQ